ncbi:hypothetical protein ABTL46_21195, partial [Acinetobacter baumannii]
KEELLRLGKRPGDASETAASAAETKLENQLRWIDQQVAYGWMSEQQAEVERAKARKKYRGEPA